MALRVRSNPYSLRVDLDFQIGTSRAIMIRCELMAKKNKNSHVYDIK